MEKENIFIRFLSNPKQVRLALLGVLVIAIVTLGVYGYQIYLNREDQAVSLAVNELIKNKKQLTEQRNENEITEEEYRTSIHKIGEDLESIYQENTSTQNALRALFGAAQIDKILADYSGAQEKLEVLIFEHTGGDLEPLSRYFLALLYEDIREYQKALDVLDPFAVDYLGHYLRPLVMFTEARIYVLQGQKDQGLAKYNEIIANQEYAFFFERVQEQLDLLSLNNATENQQGENQSTGTGLEQNYNPVDNSLSPDYDQGSQ